MTIASTRTRFSLAILLTLAMVAFAAITQGKHAQAANASVTIENFVFGPDRVTVNVGDTVTWNHNQGSIPHTVTSDAAGVMDSGSLSGGGSFKKTFETAGTFAYHCAIHLSMTGTVVVTGATAATAVATSTVPAATVAATSTVAAATAVSTSAPATTAATTAASTNTAQVPSSASTATAAVPTTAANATPAASPSVAGLAPATGNEKAAEEDDGSSGPLVIGGILVVLVVAAGAAYALLRRRTQAR